RWPLPLPVATAPKRFAERARAFNASVSRFRGGAFVTNDSRRWWAICAISSTARLKASSFAFEGLVKPLSLRTNWSDDARISSFVAGGLKLCSVLMARHMPDHQQFSIRNQLFRDADVLRLSEKT